MDVWTAVVAAAIATAFAVDLALDARRRMRPHTVAYALGVGLFAAATWALTWGLAFGWTGAMYRIFFLFGAILNIPLLALGSMYLVVGRRAGTVTALVVGALGAVAVTLTTTVPFVRPPTGTAVPHDVFAPPAEFGPRLLAAVGGGGGAVVLAVLSAVSVVRFWNVHRELVWGNGLILVGTFAAASGGTFLALGDGANFAVSLLVAVTLIWFGYRMARGSRRLPAPDPPPASPSPPPST